MNDTRFASWFTELGDAWIKKNPQKAADICSKHVVWHENPLKEPLRGKKAVLQEWLGILTQENIQYSYQILSINENVGIAKWHASYTKISDKQNVILDGIFVVTLDEKNLCKEFHQWWVAETT